MHQCDDCGGLYSHVTGCAAVSARYLAGVSTSDIAREVARRLRDGHTDAATIEAASVSLETLAALYERSSEVLDKAMKHRA
jgi:hypothetical protein